MALKEIKFFFAVTMQREGWKVFHSIYDLGRALEEQSLIFLDEKNFEWYIKKKAKRKGYPGYIERMMKIRTSESNLNACDKTSQR